MAISTCMETRPKGGLHGNAAFNGEDLGKVILYAAIDHDRMTARLSISVQGVATLIH